MQDLAREVTALLEPSEPIGYRLLLFGGYAFGTLVFEAKAVPFKGGLGFLVRSIVSEAEARAGTPVHRLSTMFAPTEDALKFLFRRAWNLARYDPVIAMLKPPSDTGHERNYNKGAFNVELDVKYDFNVDDSDSYQERALRETIAAMTVMKVPEGLKF